MQPGDLTQVIYDRGCLRSGEDWVRRNLVPVAAVAVALAVLQVYTEKKEYALLCSSKLLSMLSTGCVNLYIMFRCPFSFISLFSSIFLRSACFSLFYVHRKVIFLVKLTIKAVYLLVKNGWNKI